eukprot:CAMPEP_0182446244 /NCGR_PEP_ID=MMETSP1172-20130603/4083_1 /TAXON_ID=708627 /ORGANISM="Timspurckia oligopyrenoides, Strain CCMP3278" /LENGTH=258 /DNA_ID=CAMNT_0024642147 /DNA_START=445 /DNA_END=1221 /DNA_ORIENTATION=+
MKRSSKSTQRELFALSRLSSDSVVKVYDVFHVEQSSVLVMEHLEGGDLFDLITSSMKLEAHHIYSIAKQIIHSLVYLHGQNMAHRDLKLENIVLSRANDIQSLKLIDFGFAIPMESNQLPESDFSGTVSYQPPEQIQKLPFCGLKGDMWSLGVLLYVLVFKKLPFGDSKDPRTKLRIVERSPVIDPKKCSGISKRFLLFIQMLLDPVPESRPTAEIASKMIEVFFHSNIESRPDSIVASNIARFNTPPMTRRTTPVNV